MHTLLRLKHLTPLPTGRERYVFRHPLDPGLIVKVARSPDSRLRDRGWLQYSSVRRCRQFRGFLREMREQFVVRAACGAVPQHMQTIVGFAETDLGFATVSHAVLDYNGELAPNLKDLLVQGRFDEQARDALDRFLTWVLDFPIVINDLTLGNLVYGYDPEHGGYFVLIDGIGEKSIIPLSSLSMHYNRWNKLLRIRRAEAKIERLLQRASAAQHATEASARPTGALAPG